MTLAFKSQFLGTIFRFGLQPVFGHRGFLVVAATVGVSVPVSCCFRSPPVLSCVAGKRAACRRREETATLTSVFQWGKARPALRSVAAQA